MGGAGLVVNVASVGSCVNDNGIRTRLTESLGSKERRTAICTVNRNTEAMKIGAQGGHQVLNVGLFRPVIIVFDLTDSSAGRTIPRSVQKLLNLVFNLVGKLIAAVSEELNAVVGHGVVRGRNHDAQVN